MSRYAHFLAQSRLIRHYLVKYRKLVGLGTLCLVFIDGLEVVPPILLMKAIDHVVAGRPAEGLWILGAAYLAVALVQAVLRWGWRMCLIRAAVWTGRDLRDRFSNHVFGLGASFFDRRRIGELMALATSDVEAVRQSLGSGIVVLADVVFMFLTVPVAMLWLSPELTLISFLPLPLLPWWVARNEKKIHDRFEAIQEHFGKISGLVQESLAGVRVIKGLARERSFISKLAEAGRENTRLALRLARVQGSFGPMLDAFMSLGLVLLLYYGGTRLLDPATAGGLTLGTFVAFQRYVQKMIWPMAAIGHAISIYQRAVSSGERLLEVEAVVSDVAPPQAPRLPQGFVAGGRTAGRIEMKGLVFGFPGRVEPVLRGIDLCVEAGERIAILGAVGAGKSALLSLLPRLYPVGPGMLLLDGVDINDWPLEELRRQIGFVSQDVFLFSETVLENLAYGMLDWAEGREQVSEIEEATSLAAVHQEVLRFESAYRTRLGERGVNLSGGQKQRLTIARAIAKRPAVLVLDDALSSVDVKTEEGILAGLRARPDRNTELIAAHRISTVRDADRIAVLEGGRISELGTHAQLLRKKGSLYRRYYDQQRLKEDLENYAQEIRV